nr:hypothetical protein [Anaerolineae bacterium]
MPNRRPNKFIQALPQNNENAEDRPTKVAAGCAATGAALLAVPLCALLIIGPLFILPMWQGTQSARQPTLFDRALGQLMGVSPTPTLVGVPIKLITPAPNNTVAAVTTPNLNLTVIPPTIIVATAEP